LRTNKTKNEYPNGDGEVGLVWSDAGGTWGSQEDANTPLSFVGAEPKSESLEARPTCCEGGSCGEVWPASGGVEVWTELVGGGAVGKAELLAPQSKSLLLSAPNKSEAVGSEAEEVKEGDDFCWTSFEAESGLFDTGGKLPSEEGVTTGLV